MEASSIELETPSIEMETRQTSMWALLGPFTQARQLMAVSFLMHLFVYARPKSKRGHGSHDGATSSV